MSFLEGLAMLLDQKGIALFDPAGGASSIFLDYLPERVEHALCLASYGGEQEPPPGDLIFPRIQIRARGDRQSPRWSREALARIYPLLHGFRGELPNGIRLLNCYGLASASSFMGPDGAGRYEHVQNYQLWVCSPVPIEARR